MTEISALFVWFLLLIGRGTCTAPRELQQDNDDALSTTVSLYFSLWFPNGESWSVDVIEQEFLDSSSSSPNTPEAALGRGVLRSVQDVLCHDPNILVTNLQRDSDQELVNVCTSTTTNADGKTNRLQQVSGQSSSYAASALLQEPATIAVRKRVVDDFEWYIWTIQYRVLWIGSHFFEETVESQGNVDSEAALTTMQQALQLELNATIMEGQFDEILAENIPQAKVYSAPIRQERDTFGQIQDGVLGPRVIYHPRAWYPMRVAGSVLLLTTILAYSALFYLAKWNRKRLENEGTEADNLSIRDGSVKLISPTAVELMLSRSSLLSVSVRNEEDEAEPFEEFFEDKNDRISNELSPEKLSIQRIVPKDNIST